MRTLYEIVGDFGGRKAGRVFGLSAYLITFSFVIGCHTKADIPPNAGLSEPAVQLASYVLVDDIDGVLTRGEDPQGSIPVGDLMGLAQLDWKTTATIYDDAYDANEIAADNNYKGKKILVSGRVDSIDKDFTGDGIITLRGSGPMGIRAGLSKHGMGGAASFSRGQQVNLVCIGSGRVLGSATLEDCEPFSDYLQTLSASVDAKVTEFLSGRIAMHKTEASVVSTTYVLGLSLPADSPCMNGKKDSCRTELAALFADQSKRQAILNQSKQMMASLKVN